MTIEDEIALCEAADAALREAVESFERFYSILVDAAAGRI